MPASDIRFAICPHDTSKQPSLNIVHSLGIKKLLSLHDFHSPRKLSKYQNWLSRADVLQISEIMDSFHCELGFRGQCHNVPHPLVFLPPLHLHNEPAVPILLILNTVELLDTWMPNYTPTPSQTPCPNQLYLQLGPQPYPNPVSISYPAHVANTIPQSIPKLGLSPTLSQPCLHQDPKPRCKPRPRPYAPTTFVNLYPTGQSS